MSGARRETAHFTPGSARSLRGKLTLVVLLTTAIALLTMTTALLHRDLTQYWRSLAADLDTEAGILALSTAPAVSFDDQRAAQRNLSALSAKSAILSAALYTADGQLYARYVRPGAQPPPARLAIQDVSARLANGRMQVSRGIVQGGETLGTIRLTAAYDLWGHVGAYLRILGLIMVLSMIVALILAARLRRSITAPVDALAGVAHEIVTRGDRTLRAPDTPLDEFAQITRAFNSVLAESETNTRELQQINRSLTQQIEETRAAEAARRVAESALRQSEQLYRAIGESINYGVWVCDASGRNVYASDSLLRLLGVTQAQCSNLGWTELLHPDDVQASVASWLECVRTGGTWYREHRFRGTDGHYHPVLAQGVPIHNEEGELTGWAGINLDIGRIKHTEEALRDADRRKDEFLATLAHELRNPLAPIRHAARLLGLRGLDEAQSQSARDIISRQVARMALLLDDLLEVSRITRGHLELRPEPVSAGSLVRAAVETTRPLIESKSHRLSIQLPEEDFDIVVDPLRISQALSNLLTNAAKYTDPGGRILLQLRRGEDDVVFSVTDSGIGVPAAALPTIFEMFSQVNSAIDRSEGGLGIGLALVKGLISMHGGNVDAASEGPGRGSTFTIRIPGSSVREKARGHGTDQPQRAQQGPRGRVLVVDDNRDAADSLAMVLGKAGHETFTAYTGERALQIGEREHPDVIVLDIGMPDMTGYEAAQRVRRTKWGNDILLLAITGWGQKEDIERALKAGFDFHMTKPADPEHVENLLADYLQSRLRTGSKLFEEKRNGSRRDSANHPHRHRGG
jgi:PAS domain S-box-containing protein